MHSYTFVYVYYNAIIQKYNYGVNRGSVFFLGGSVKESRGQPKTGALKQAIEK